MSRPDVLTPPSGTGPVATLDRPLTERRVLVAIMGCTVLVEVALELLDDKGSIDVGRIPVSLVVAPALVMVLAVGPSRLLGERRLSPPYPLGFWLAGAVALASASVLYVRTFHDWIDVGGILLAAFTEEAVYRLAVPVFFAAILVRLGLRPAWARATGFVLAGAWWVFLPGHVEQMHGGVALASFVAAALLFALVVVRSGSLLAATLTHAVMNLLAFAEWANALGQHDRRLLVASLLALLVLAFGRRRAPAGDHVVIDLRDEATVIDLTAAVAGSPDYSSTASSSANAAAAPKNR